MLNREIRQTREMGRELLTTDFKDLLVGNLILWKLRDIDARVFQNLVKTLTTHPKRISQINRVIAVGHARQHVHHVCLPVVISECELTNYLPRAKDRACLSKLLQNGLTGGAVSDAHLIYVGGGAVRDTNINGQWRCAAKMRSPRLKVDAASKSRESANTQYGQVTPAIGSRFGGDVHC